MVPLGFMLAPDLEFLDLCDELIREDVDYYEVTPETLWFVDERGDLQPNGYFHRFSALRTPERFFVGHGVGLSLAGSAPSDAPRRRRHLARLREDHRAFDFRWYSDHLGASSLDGQAMALPLPVPMTSWAASLVRRRLRALQSIFADVGVENSAFYFLPGDPLAEPAFLGRITGAPGVHLLLDLHNLSTAAENFRFDPAEYLDRLDLARVVEIHLSGGADSDPAWLPGGRVMRLDSHDAHVPEPVWRLLEEVLPRCPGLRGVTLERMEGTVGPGDVADLREELRRARRLLRRH